MNFKHLPNWAHSAKQRPIALYHSVDFQWGNNEKPIVFIGGVHGDEPEGVRLAEDLLSWIQQTEESEIKKPWILIPCLNADGYAENKRTNGNGVDLNRNYPSSNWSEDHKEKRYYPGPSPGSEPEVKAIVKLIKEVSPRVIIHFHSWEPCVVATGEPAYDFAKLLSDSSGYELKMHIGYDTPGSLSQFGWHDNQVPIICTEEQEFSDLEKTWNHFGPGLISILTS